MVLSRSTRARSLATVAIAVCLLQESAVRANDLTDLAGTYDSGPHSGSGSGSYGSFEGSGESAFPPYRTQEPLLTDPSLGATPGGATSCPFPVSPGDFAVGVQLVGDATCVNGGLGCFQGVCRFCQHRPTPQSSHLLTCQALGYDFGTPAPTPAPTPMPAPTPSAAPTPVPPADPDTGCPYPASSGDISAGVQLVGDAACALGGIGCFKDVCRFCKLRETPQSKGWVPCSDLGYPRTQAPDFNPVSIDDYGCPYSVTDGDVAVGVQLVGDGSCVNGGLGCFKDVCRYCQFDSTPASSHLLTCQSLGYTIANDTPLSPQDVFDPTGETNCPYAVSGSDFDVGVQLIGDASCAKGGLGCYADVCRFCKFKENPLSAHLLKCGDVAASAPTPQATTEPPTAIPQDIEEPDPVTKCPFYVPSGDFAVGIQLVGDATCATGGLGCYENVCRFCKFEETAQSTGWLTCTELGYPQFGTPIIPPTTALPTAIPQDIEEPDPVTKCPFKVTEGDFAVGIQLVGDATCATGGLGCYLNVCRFCKFEETAQSTGWLTCTSLGYAEFGTPTTTTPAAVTIAPPVVPDAVTQCPYSVSTGDLAVGVQLVGDASCSAGGIGCFKDVCRYCKFLESPQSTGWLTCTELGFPQFEPVITPQEVVDTGCPYGVSSGDFAAGIQLVGDATCASGGIGCFEDVCRYCQVRPTPQSSDWMTCDSLGYSFGPTRTPAPAACDRVVSAEDAANGLGYYTDPTCLALPTTTASIGCDGVCRRCQTFATNFSHRYWHCPAQSTPTPTPAPGPTTCPYTVSEGDAATGVQLVGDATCASGGIGCFENVCRYCKVFDSPQSTDYLSCASLGHEAPASSEEAACDQTPSEGNVAGGVDIVTDATCLEGGVGCVEKSVCRYCKVSETTDNGHMEWCSDIIATDHATAAAAAGTVKLMTTRIKTLRAAAKASKPKRKRVKAAAHKSVSTASHLDELLKDSTFKWSLLGAACVGVVAVVALVALGAKRIVTRRRSAKPAVEEAAESETETETAVAKSSEDAVLEGQV